MNKVYLPDVNVSTYYLLAPATLGGAMDLNIKLRKILNGGYLTLTLLSRDL
jgi:hypothetical protein